MIKDIYLSIDLDYWQYESFNSFKTIVNEVIERKLPLKIVPHHEQLLPHINRFQCPVLFNVDYHADIADNPKPFTRPELNCGTWVNHIRIPSMELYTWIYSRHGCIVNEDGKPGRSNEDGSQFCNNNPRQNPFFVKKPKPLCFWDATQLRNGERNFLKPHEMERVKAVGIAVSYAWGGHVHYNSFNGLMKKHNKRFSKKHLHRINVANEYNDTRSARKLLQENY